MGAEILFSSYWINSTYLDFTPPTTSFHHCQIPNKLKVPPLDPHPCDPGAQMTSLKYPEPDKMLSGWSSEDLHKIQNYYRSNSIFPLTYTIISGMCHSQYWLVFKKQALQTLYFYKTSSSWQRRQGPRPWERFKYDRAGQHTKRWNVICNARKDRKACSWYTGTQGQTLGGSVRCVHWLWAWSQTPLGWIE